MKKFEVEHEDLNEIIICVDARILQLTDHDEYMKSTGRNMHPYGYVMIKRLEELLEKLEKVRGY